MEKEATKTFGIVLDYLTSIYKDIQLQFYQILDLDEKKLSIYENEDIKIKEEIKASIERFSFNLQELDFLAQVKEIIEEEMKKLQTTGNYDLMQNSLLERLKGLRNIDISLEDDFKELSGKIANPFLSKDMFYNYFIARKEKITDMIKSCNQSIIDSLITLTPQLIELLKKEKQKENKPIAQEEKQKIENSNSTNNNIQREQLKNETTANSLVSNKNVDITQSNIQEKKVDNFLSVDSFIAKCSEKLNEIDLLFNNANNMGITSKTDIAKGYRQLKTFTDSLNDKTFAQEILNKYMKLNEIDQNMIYDQIIFQNVPSLKEIYDKYQELIIENNSRKENKPKEPTPNISTYIGKSQDEIKELIKNKQYFVILQTINRSDMAKYSDFINKGYQIMINNFYEKAKNCKTYDERHNSYFELYEIYQNFRDYISLEKSNELREQLDNMLKFLQQESKKDEIIGVKYNTSVEEHKETIRRM